MYFISTFPFSANDIFNPSTALSALSIGIYGRIVCFENISAFVIFPSSSTFSKDNSNGKSTSAANACLLPLEWIYPYLLVYSSYRLFSSYCSFFSSSSVQPNVWISITFLAIFRTWLSPLILSSFVLFKSSGIVRLPFL